MIEYKDGKIQIDAISKKDLESQIEDIKQKIKTEESKEKPDKEKINELKFYDRPLSVQDFILQGINKAIGDI